MKKTNKKIDMAELIGEVRHEISALNGKIDTVINRLAAMAPQARPAMSQAPSAPRPLSQPAANSNSNYTKPMFKTVCADCKKECEVPFKPTEGRPVYCKECFSKRRSTHSFKPVVQAEPKKAEEVPTVKKVSAAKKKTSPKKRKSGK